VITLSNVKPIFTIFAPLERELNFQQIQCNIFHLTLTLVPHYTGKVNRLIYHKTRAHSSLALFDQFISMTEHMVLTAYDTVCPFS